MFLNDGVEQICQNVLWKIHQHVVKQDIIKMDGKIKTERYGQQVIQKMGVK